MPLAMERDHHRYKCDIESEMKTPEVNGNSPSNFGKKKKIREKKKKKSSYLQEWVDKSVPYNIDPESVEGPPSSFWSPPTRLFAAVSDPAVYRYSVPLGYSLEPISLPVYQPLYQSHIAVTSSPTRGNRPVSTISGAAFKKHHTASHQKPPPPPVNCMPTPLAVSSTACDPGQEFASLPPVIQSLNASDSSQRRFSDPGLGPADSSSDDGSGSAGDMNDGNSPATVGLVLTLMEQVNALQDSNRRLFRELHNTRAELEALKLQTASWRQLPPEYEPGMLSDLIREVRDATRIREEALISRVCNMVGNSDRMKWGNFLPHPVEQTNSSTDRTSQTSVGDYEEIRKQLKCALADKATTDERLQKLEAQLKNIHISNGVAEPSPQDRSVPGKSRGGGTSPRSSVAGNDDLSQQLQQLQVDKARLVTDLLDALAGRKDAEAHASKMEKLLDMMRKKLNGVSQQEEKQAEVTHFELSPSSLENTSESLVSVCSGSTGTGRSLQSPQVTMSGPVTDL